MRVTERAWGKFSTPIRTDLMRYSALPTASLHSADQNSFNTDVPFRSINGRAIWSSQAAIFVRSILNRVMSPS